MKTADSVMMNPVISELNRVPNFDPLKFMRNTENGPRLDLKYKKLWFRLKYPNGRIRVSNLRVTDQLAIIEARVFFDRKDTEWVSNYTAECDISRAPNGEYLKAAQDMAIDQALSDAGFGIQLTADGNVASAVNTPPATAPVKAVVPEVKAQPIATAPTQTVATLQNTSIPTERKAETVVTGETVVPSATAVKVEPVAQATVVEEEVIVDIPNEAPANVQKNQAPAPVVNTASAAPQAEKVITMPAAQPIQTEAVNTPAAATPVASAPITASVVNTPVIVTPKAETTPSFSKDMSVEELCAVMTLEDAENYVVPSGACAGQKMSMVAERRAASLRFYMNGYKGDDNILRAAATIITNAHPELLAG